MAGANARLDELVKEYLLYRGLSNSSRVYENELKSEKDKSLRVDRIIEQLGSYISNQELTALWDYWSYLNVRFFSRLEHRYTATVQKLEKNLLKFYVVTAYQHQRSDKVREFFEVMASELQGQDSFRDWFAFPFLKNVEENSSFSMYFSRQWQDTFYLSLANFLSIIIQSMATPSFLNFEVEAKKIKNLQEENNSLRAQLNRLRLTTDDPQDSIPIQPAYYPDNTMEILDDFFVINGDQVRKGKSLSKPEKKKSIFAGTTLLGLKPQQTPPVNGNTKQGTSNNTTKTPKAKTTASENKTIIGKARQSLMPSASAPLLKTVRNTVVESTKPAPTTVQNKVEDRLILPAPPVVQKKSSDMTEKSSTHLRELRDSHKRSSPVKTLAKTTGFTSYIDSVLPSQAVSIGQTDSHSPFLLLSQETYGEHSSTVMSVKFSYSSHYIVSVDKDGIVKIWTWSPQPVTKATVMLKPAFLSAEWANKTDRHVILGTKTGNIRLYDVKENKSVREMPTDAAFPCIVGISSSPSGGHFVTSGMSNAVRSNGTSDPTSQTGKLSVWELKTMKILGSLTTSPMHMATNCMTFNHNGQLLLAGGADGKVRLYDVHQSMCINEWHAHSGDVTAIQFSSDENSCYTMGTDDKFLQWSMNRCGQQVNDISLHSGACNPDVLLSDSHPYHPRGKLFAFDAEGACILTCGPTGGIIYQLLNNTATQVLELKHNWSPVSSLDWSPIMDTRICLTGSFDGRIQVSTFLTK